MYCNIQIDKADMDKVMSKLRSAGKNTPKHLKNAINRTVSQAVKQIKDGRKNAYTIKARRFNDAITVQRPLLTILMRQSGLHSDRQH